MESLSTIRTDRVNATADGDNTIIAAPGPGKRIRVLGYRLRVGTGAFVVKSGAAGTQHIAETTAAAETWVYPGGLDGQAFNCDVNAALVVNNPAAQDTLGHVTYVVTDS